MLSESDRYPVEYSDRVNTLLRRLTRDQLLALVKRWFEVPELRPSLSTWEDYAQLETSRKFNVFDRIVVQDWRNGLCALQIAQIDMTCNKTHDQKIATHIKSFTGRSNEQCIPQKVESLETADLTSPGQHVHGYVHDKTETHWYRIMVFDDLQTRTLPASTNNAYLIHYPNTEFVLCGGTLKKEIKRYVVQSFIEAFGADDIQEEDLTSKRMDRLQEIILNRKSLGVFDQFRKNQFDGNPLDVRQQVKKMTSEGYVKTREERRRIVPIHQDLIRERSEETARKFGRNVAQGVESLQFNTHMGVGTNVPGDDEELNVTMKMKGMDVMEGLRQLSLRGILQPPFPDWLTDVVSSGVDHVLIREDGVFKESVEEEILDNTSA
ncbi:hypothetical protein DFQ28_010453 [Apophysomyces sp. BC1034]|nr:hypothetical protein DFQ29_008961 [Apophysomyces sp. BC1021]KAG0184790.1 hypothetical protein DFQ28_010453 [Apophysomyces sp. BC1034]